MRWSIRLFILLTSIVVVGCQTMTQNKFAEASPSLKGSNLVRDWSDELNAELPLVPFSAVYSRDQKKLVYLGVAHGNLLNSSSMQSIKNAFAQTKFDFVLLEGFPASKGLSPQSMTNLASRDGINGFYQQGETGLAIQLAVQQKAQFVGAEPDETQVKEAILKTGYSAEDLLFFYLVRQIPEFRRQKKLSSQNKILFAEFLKTWSRILNVSPEPSFDKFLGWYKEKNGHEFKTEEIGTEIPAPYKDGRLFTQRISSIVDRIRNEFIVNQIENSVQTNNNVLVIFGSSHWVTQKLALEDFMGSPQIISLETARALPRIGAIRWDAWYGTKSPPGLAVTKTLSPKQWHNRLPFFAQEISNNQVFFPGYSPEIMDREIQYAREGGIDYWAFTLYDERDDLSNALRLYLENKNRKDVGFSAIIGPWLLQTDESRLKLVRRLMKLVQDGQFEKTPESKPILYYFYDHAAVNCIAAAKLFFTSLKKYFEQAHLPPPYIVVMSPNPVEGQSLLKKIGADALSAYAIQNNEKRAPFKNLARFTEKFWNQEKYTGAEVVPTVMTGWDRRPRVENPVPWEQLKKVKHAEELFYEQPKILELTQHVRSAIDWVKLNPQVAIANSILIYAWNEYDEGGWLPPGLDKKSDRLSSIRQAKH